jgi:hypothetical protein
MFKQWKLLQLIQKNPLILLQMHSPSSRNQLTHLMGFQDSLKDILDKPTLDKDFNFFMKIMKPFVFCQQAFENIFLKNLLK